jgi:hypothetical protein
MVKFKSLYQEAEEKLYIYIYIYIYILEKLSFIILRSGSFIIEKVGPSDKP